MGPLATRGQHQLCPILDPRFLVNDIVCLWPIPAFLSLVRFSLPKADFGRSLNDGHSEWRIRFRPPNTFCTVLGSWRLA
jgi:hypothetical protein